MVNATIFSFFLFAIPTESVACSIIFDERSAFEIRSASEPVAVDRQCRMINGGVRDNLRLGQSQSLGNGRVYQVINEDPSRVLLADCNTKEVTYLRGTATQIGETSCGPEFEFASLVGDNAVLSLSDGEDLHQLVSVASEIGVREFNPNRTFFEFTINYSEPRYEVWQRDRFDLLCGCGRHFPESLGANQ